MKYLCLIYLDEQKMAALPDAEMNALNARHLALNDELRASGHFVEAEALEPAAAAARNRVRREKTVVTDGPFTESKEVVAGFYLVEARDLDEATRIAARFPRAASRQPARAAASAARASSKVRSRAFLVSAAARSNSARASSKRPSFASRSPRTLGSRW